MPAARAPATFDVSTGAQVDLEGSYTWGGANTGSGGGQVVADITQGDAINADGATFDFPTGMLDWTNGPIDGNFTNLGDLTVSGASANAVSFGNTFTNTGTIELDSTLSVGNIYSGSAGAFLNNQPGGTITLVGTAGIAGETFNQGGTLVKTGAGTATVDCTSFNNLEAPMEVSGGTLVFAAGGTSTGAAFTVAAGAEVDFTAQSTWSGDYSGSGGGLVVFEPITDDALVFNDAALDFAPGMLECTSGTFFGSLTNVGSLALDTVNPIDCGANLINEGSLEINQGVVDQQGIGSLSIGSIYGAGSIDNRTGATLVLAGTTLQIGAGGDSLLHNEGTMEIGAGLTLNGHGDATISNTGTIKLDAGSSLNFFTTDTGGVIATGTYDVGAGASIAFADPPYGYTNITTNDATISLEGPGAAVTGLGSLATSAETLEVTDGATLSLTGPFKNTGTLTLGPGGVLNVRNVHPIGERNA